MTKFLSIKDGETSDLLNLDKVISASLESNTLVIRLESDERVIYEFSQGEMAQAFLERIEALIGEVYYINAGDFKED